jgi:plastocyanin
MKSWRVKSGAVAGVVAGALLFAACNGGGDPINRDPSPVASTPMDTSGASPTAAASPTTAGGRDSITISNFMFSPMTITVAPGATITVTNKDSAAHTLTSTDGTTFNSGIINQNQTKTITVPTKPGKYSYICNIHQYMVGTINVR